VEVVQAVPVPEQWAADISLMSPPSITYASPAPGAVGGAPMMYLADPADDGFDNAFMASEVRAAPASPPRRERVVDTLRRAFRAAPSKKAKGESSDGEDACGMLAREQRADGSFDGDVRTTAAALVALVQAGHTRISGDRRRTVLKAATWLSSRSEGVALAALRVLDAVEGGAAFPGIPPELGDLGALGLAGQMLGSVARN